VKLFAALVAAVAAYAIVTAILDWERPRPVRVSQRNPRSKGRLQRRLDETGAGVSARRYRTTVAGTVLLVALVIYAATGTGALAIPPALAVGLTPRLFFQRRHAKVVQERRAAWPEAIRDVLANLATGQTLHRSLCLLGHAGPQSLRPTWLRYERNAAGLDQSTALDLARAELSDPVSDRVIEALGAAQEHGRDVVVAVLRSLADNVTKDLQVVEQIATSQTEIRSQAVVAVILPFGVLAFLVASNDGYRSFYQSTGGWIVVSIGVLMALGGWKLITVLGRVPTEPRVLVEPGARR
jgi:Flp pilus assembly protein TadB